ncbi:uncharacterized protein SPSK_04639 [Sporothrix schenckii 1099-18]|uniref:Uncharacterized protein n=1 Tax=Sporothrix schenckii 1099-18 TaxID=1397361 RepID=A0A0F2M125_SPOSC|nr:uncharacterized protein SPSK_04639 [Sporothrix schenckii 1099-18]KJR83418.1 hypothetical protein SPSK_04639 [Sporothrix schenckii 1099-18]
MPAQFASDPPLWLARYLPSTCLDRGYFAWFLREYEPLLQRFLDAMRRAERERQTTTTTTTTPSEQTPLSTLMYDSWTTGRVWFDYALNNSDHVDGIYWAVFHRSESAPELPSEAKAEMERYVQFTASQLADYEDSWDSYFLAKAEA